MNFRAPSTCSNFSYTSATRDSRIVVDRRFPRLIRFDNCLLACLVEDSVNGSNTRNKIKLFVLHLTYIHIAHMFFVILITSFIANSDDRKRQDCCIYSVFIKV